MSLAYENWEYDNVHLCCHGDFMSVWAKDNFCCVLTIKFYSANLLLIFYNWSYKLVHLCICLFKRNISSTNLQGHILGEKIAVPDILTVFTCLDVENHLLKCVFEVCHIGLNDVELLYYDQINIRMNAETIIQLVSRPPKNVATDNLF